MGCGSSDSRAANPNVQLGPYKKPVQRRFEPAQNKPIPQTQPPAHHNDNNRPPKNVYGLINQSIGGHKADTSYKAFELTNTRTLNDETLKRFVQVQSEIDEHERSGVFDGLRIAEEEFENLEKNKRQAEINHKVLTEQTKKEKQDFENISLPSVQSYFKDSKAREKAISKEQEEYLQSMNQLEISTNELKAITEQYERSKEKLARYKKEHQKAIELYNEQMSILHSTFEGDFGSETENRLEKEVRTLQDQKEELRSALHKWSNARFLLVHAYNQIQCSENRWSELMKLSLDDPEKAIYATEVRNNLVAANQNLMNTRSYLKNVELPYCTEEDLKTLQNLASGCYKDMMTVERQKYVLGILQALRKRCAALNQWFDQVIKDVLVVDFSKIRIDYDQKSKQLKMERIKLLQEKIKEKTGKDVQIHVPDMASDKKNDNVDMNPIVNQPAGGKGDTSSHEILEKPINSYDLPPPPSRDQILGNVEKIKQDYFQQNESWNKHLDASKREADERLNKVLSQYN